MSISGLTFHKATLHAVRVLLVTIALSFMPQIAFAEGEPYNQLGHVVSGMASGDERLNAWIQMKESIRDVPDQQKLTVVNSFFNQVPFIEDQSAWQKKDYWASPRELLIKNGGDCEDYAIAKYFSLLEAGVPEEKLSMVYVQILPNRQAHMVLSYNSPELESPVILDNFIDDVLSVDNRVDLVPVYSFNGSNLWLVSTSFRYTAVGAADRIKPWYQLQQRMLASSRLLVARR